MLEASWFLPEPPQLDPFNVEKQCFYSEPLPNDGAPKPISKGEASHLYP